jgi:hypothetical protein
MIAGGFDTSNGCSAYVGHPRPQASPRQREREKVMKGIPFDCVPHRVKALFAGNTLESTVIPVV